MRTTIRLEDALLRKAKAIAAGSGKSLNDFIEDAVRAAVAPRATRRVAPALPVFAGNGLHAGVDLDDSGALLELMDHPVHLYAQASERPRRAAEPSRTSGRPRGQDNE